MLTIREDDLSGEAVKALLALHLAGMRAGSPPGSVFALDLSGLKDPAVTVWSVWDGPALAGIGALKALGDGTGEVKSMRTHPEHLRRGVAAALLAHIVAEAQRRGLARLSLETGSGPAFEPALALYRSRGFVDGPAFGGYEKSAFNRFLHFSLAPSLGVPVPGWVAPPWPGPMRLEGRYVRLEPLAPGHAAALFAANRVDDAIWDYLPYGPFPEAEGYRAWVEAVAGKPDPLFFALTDRGVGTPGGVASLMRINPEAGSIEVGHINLSPSLQRTRAASEAIFLFADWVFREGFRRFEWKCNALNRASRRAAERFGFSFEGVFRNHSIVKGRNRDTAWFAMTDADWACLQPAWEAWLDPANFDAGGRQRLALGGLTMPCRAAADPGR